MTRTHRTFPLTLGLWLRIVVFAAGIFFLGCNSATQPTRLALAKVRTVTNLSSDNVEPFGIAVKKNVVYFSDGANGTIRQLASDGSTKVIASGLQTPSAIAFLPNGDLAVADTGSHTIKRVTPDGTITIIAGVDGTSGASDGAAASATFNAPIGLTVDDKGVIYVADTYNDRIRVIREGLVSTLAGSSRGFADDIGASAQFDTPQGIAMWGDKLLVADSGNGRLRIVEQNGDVRTFIDSGNGESIDGPLSTARFAAPTSVTTDEFGRIFVVDVNAIRVIGRRVFPFVETLSGTGRGLADGNAKRSRFSRPSGLAVGGDGEVYVADSDNGAVRVMSDTAPTEQASNEVADPPLPLAVRWPFEPPSAVREVAGTLGEVRGVIGPENKPVWFHNGLDIAGAYGETARFLRDETVLDPQSTANFATARELLRLPLLGYIHLRLGRDQSDRTLGDPRFQFDRDVSGKLTGVRVRRGTRFAAGDALGTLNSMNHVHLIAGRPGHEINAFAALTLPGATDSIPPTIEGVSLFTSDWQKIDNGKLTGQTRVVVRAYDRMDGNSDRRRLGVYRVGYQLLSNGAPLGEMEWTIQFRRTPPNDAVRFVYADGSRSGYTPDTVFDYIATNRVNGNDFSEDFLDASTLAPGVYTLRVFVGDFFGNVTSKDVQVEVSGK